MRVVWDEAKNLENRRKHGLSFEEAEELFASGADYLEIFDEAHSVSEDRFIAIGPVTGGIVLVVWTALTTIRSVSSVLAGPMDVSKPSTTPIWVKAND